MNPLGHCAVALDRQLPCVLTDRDGEIGLLQGRPARVRESFPNVNAVHHHAVAETWLHAFEEQPERRIVHVTDQREVYSVACGETQHAPDEASAVARVRLQLQTRQL